MRLIPRCVNKTRDLENFDSYRGRNDMMSWALAFLIIALIAGVLGFTGIAGAAANIAWILFVVGLILAVVFFFRGRSHGPKP